MIYFYWPTPSHGPRTWPWWRLVTFAPVLAKPMTPPNTGHHFWIYTRWGARMLGIYFDRRGPATRIRLLCWLGWSSHPREAPPAHSDSPCWCPVCDAERWC